MNRTAIDILVPVYRSSKYLKECLCSLVDQDFSFPYRILIVDFGDDTGCSEIYSRFSQDYDFVYFYRFEKNRGVSFSRNFAISICIADYFTFVDGDDVVKKDYLSSLFERAQRYETDITTGGYCILEKDKVKNGYSRAEYVGNGRDVVLRIYNSPKMKFRTFCWGRLYRTEAIRKSGVLFDSDLEIYEDWEFVSKLMFSCDKVFFFKKPIYVYRQHSDSLIHDGKHDRSEYHIEAIRRSLAYFDDKDKEWRNQHLSRPSLSMKAQIKFDCGKNKQKKKEAIRRLKEVYKGDLNDE